MSDIYNPPENFSSNALIGSMEKYQEKYPELDHGFEVNGTFTPPAQTLLDKIPWDLLYEGVSSFMHGDLQFDNVLYTDNDDFILLDWRQEFGGYVEFGDLYYDLAKLYHGLIINGTIAKEKKYSLNIKQNIADISYQSKNNLLDFNKILESFCKNHRLDYEKVKLLGVLQYVNIAIFYQDTEPEYSKFIFLLGKLLMTEILGSDGADK